MYFWFFEIGGWMNWARLILLAIIGTVGFLDYKVWTSVDPRGGALPARFILTFFSAPFILAAIITFTLSFLKADVSGGRLVLKSDSFLMKLTNFFSLEKVVRNSKMDVCRLFWMTTWSLFMLVSALVMLSLVTFAAGAFFVGVFKNGFAATVTNGRGFEKKDVIFLVGFLGATFLGIPIISGLTIASCEKAKTKTRKALTMIVGGLLIVAIVAIWLPTVDVATKSNITLAEALRKHWQSIKDNLGSILLAIGVMISIFATAVGLVAGFFWGFKSLRRSLVGRIFSLAWQGFKTKTCPLVQVVGDDPLEPKEAHNGS